MSDKPIDVPLDLTQDIPEMTGEGLDLDEAWDHGEDVFFDDDPAEAAMAEAEPEDTLPPERVRFTAPMVMRRDDESIDGALLNLSARGVAAIAPAEARPGDRVWIQFRLHLAEDPISLLCEVIWCSAQDDGDWAYGLRFASITQDEERRVRAVVVERSEGRAGEWPLPVMPDPTATAKPTSPWLSAAAGMAAGIGLALALSVIPTAGITSTTAARAEPPPPPQKEVLVAKLDVPTPAPGKLVLPPKPAVKPPPAPEPEPIAKPALATEPAPVVAAPPPAPARDPDLLPRKDSALIQPDGGVLRPLGTASGVEIALLTDGSVADHVSFWLDEPKRLVVDIYGRKSGFTRRAYNIEHPLANQIRVGQHSGKVRFVIETAANVSPQVRTRGAGKALVVELRRK